GDGTNNSALIAQNGTTGTQTITATGTVSLVGGGASSGSGNRATIQQSGSGLQHLTANALQITASGGATGINNNSSIQTNTNASPSQQVDVGAGGITMHGGTGSAGNNKAGIWVLADLNLPSNATVATQVVNVTGGGSITLTAGDNATNSPSGNN